MRELIYHTAYFGVVISIVGYALGVFLQKRLRMRAVPPLLVSVVLVIAVLLLFRIDYGFYEASAQPLSYLLTPATVCLAIPLYQQLTLLRKNWKAVAGGAAVGVLTGLCSILALSWLFRLDHATYVSLLPKSITTAIGIGVSEELGGVATLTVAAIIFTGILGSVIGPWVLKKLRIVEPAAVGLALGASAHAIGTTRALELGEVEGAMSSLAIVVSGLMTVMGASFFAQLY